MSYPPPHYPGFFLPPGSYPPPAIPGQYPPPYEYPQGQYPPHLANYPPPANYPGSSGQYPQPYYIPATMMVPVPVGPLPMPVPSDPQNHGSATYITNYIYHGKTPSTEEKVEEVKSTGSYEWVTSTATLASSSLEETAFSGGHEGWDGSPLWVIRARHDGDLIPGKLSLRHNSALIPYGGKEIAVQNIEVLCAKLDQLKWVPATDGQVPQGAIEAGHKKTGERLYVGRGRYQLSLTPGKVDPEHSCCYISFSGQEVCLKMYDVLCTV